MEQVKDDNSEVLQWSLLNVQVCSKLSEQEALDWVRVAMPAGTSGNWMKDDRPEARPVACADGGGRTHYVFIC